MSYQLIANQPNKIRRLADGAVIPLTQKPGITPIPQTLEYQAWLADGNTPEPADPPPPPPADWRGFLNALKQTTVFTTLRGNARADVAANALATEMRTALGEAALGLVDSLTIQALLDELIPTLTNEQVVEIQDLITANNIPLVTE